MLFGDLNNGDNRLMRIICGELHYLFKLIKSLIARNVRLFVFHDEFALLSFVDFDGTEMLVV
jgi:hypothetical protein